ncbi:hypothetical protein PIB30_055474 [Stylosanthes scabra]|uniref:Uncharacterized protein n=1 Tax=Stylosanthes scabra TaxID=79078 RepID=A0ABU6RJ06_9FABA|nr:hypothetical protein [Stylosanthes scabra]
MSNRSVRPKNQKIEPLTVTLGSFTASQSDRRRLSNRRLSGLTPPIPSPFCRVVVHSSFVFIRGTELVCLRPSPVSSPCCSASELRPPPSVSSSTGDWCGSVSSIEASEFDGAGINSFVIGELNL